VRVAQNYGGAAAIQDIIVCYPDLTFNGVLINEMEAQPGGAYSTFVGIDGETQFWEFSHPAEEHVMTSEEIGIHISRIDQKIADLTETRELYSRRLSNSKSGVGESLDGRSGARLETEASVHGKASQEVANIVAKLKAGKGAAIR
jgi:hypothetical protein